MDKIFSEPNEENDCTEHVRKKRLSSILKVPRSPLQDLGSGNEFTQDYHAEKRRKSSRRVSFADTINFRVFKTDVKVNMAEPGNAETATDVRNQVLLNHSVQRPGQSPVGQNGYLDYVNEGSETAQCEITGMDTLLHAPIQTSVQQTEQCNVDHTSEEMNRHDRTLIFSDENEMDMTASCTAVIMRSNLKRNQETDQPRKIDFTSFMAELASRSEEMAKEFRFFSDPTNDACSSLQQKPDNTVKKINFNEFLMSVKSSEEVANPTFAMPDKKNLFFVSPQVLEGNVFSPMEDAYNYAQERTCNMTKIFRGQDDGMDVTKCHSSDMKTFFPATCEASSKQLGHEDITVAFRNDGMDMTASHTVKLSFTRNGPSNTENQNQNISMDFSSNFVSGNSRLEGPPNYQFGVQKGPQTCVGTKTVNAKDEVDFTRSHTISVDEHEVTQISKQGARAMVMMPGSVSSGAVFLDNKTISSTCNDMDVTGKCTEVICKETCRETCGSYAASQKPENATPLLMENTISGQNDDMDIKKRHITLDNQVLGQCKIREPVISSVLENRSKMAIQNHRTVALYVGVNSHANSSFWPSKCGFQDNLANSHIVSGEEMDLTKSYIANGIEKSIENEFPSDTSTSITNKPQSFGSIPTACNLNEQEEMEITKRHAVVTGNQTTRITAGLEQMQPKITCESWKKTISEAVSPLNSNKENLLLVRGNNINVEIIHTLGTNVRDLKGQVDFEKAGEKNAYVGGLHSITKNIFSLQEPDKEVPQRQTTATNRHAQTNFQKQASEISQPLNKSIFDHSLAFANDERGIFSDDQDMDITRNHTVALAFASTSGQQKCETTHSQNNTVSKTQQLQNNTLLFSGDFSTDITRSQTVAVACGNFKMSSKQEHPMPGSDQTPEPVAPSVSFISSNETVPCGIKGYMQCGKTAGIYLSDKESELQGQSHTMEPLSEGMPDIANSEKLLSTSKRVSSEEDVSKSHIAANNDMYLRCAEESLLTRTSRPYSKNPQLSPCPEKSVVFSSKENMDPTGSYSLNVQANSPDKVLKEEKVLAKYVNRVEDNILFPKEKDVITTDSLRPMISDKNMLNLTDLKPMSLLNEKTVQFSEDNDMEITKNHTVAADKMYAQKKSSNRALLCFPADKTCVFTCSDDMEITTLNTVVTDKPVEMAASQVVPKPDKGAGRKSQIGSTGEKTTLFSYGVETDMEVTESCTAAIDHQISSKSQRAPCEPTLRHVDKSHVSMCNDDMEITALNTVVIDKPIEKAASQVVPKVGKEAGRKSQIELTGEKTRLFSFGVENDMEITESCTAAIDRQISSKGQKMPCEPTLHYVDRTHVSTCNDDMEITALNTVIIDRPIEKAASQVMPKVGKGAGRKSQIELTGEKTRLFSFGVENDMEVTESCTAAIDHQISSKSQRAPCEPTLRHVDKSHVSMCNDDMEITALNTVVIDKPIEKAASQVVPKVGKGAGRKSQIELTGEKTRLFSFGVENDMEITESCTASINRQISSKGQKMPCEPTLHYVDRTHVSTCNDDMEITALNTVIIDRPIEKAASQVMPKVGKGAGRKSQIELTGEKTRLFSFGVENDMEVTESCTAAIDHQISSKSQRAPCEPTLRHVDKSHVSMCNDDMEITALNTVVIDKPIEKAASQVVPKVGKGAGRKSQIELTGEKTRLFSFGVENDMEITESCTASINRQISSKGQKMPCEPTLHYVDKTHVFTCNDDMEITALNTGIIDKPIEKAASQVVPKVGKEAGRKSQMGLTGEKTRLFSFGVENDMEITESCTAAIDRQISSKDQEPPLLHLDKNIEFAFNQDDMQITESRAVPRIVQRVMSKDQLKLDAQVGQEALSNNKTVIFPMGENMEIIKIPEVAVDYNEIALRGGQPNQTVPIAPVDKTIVFTGNQVNMEITASHTTAVNNTLKGYENQDVSDEGGQQQSLHRKPSSTCREKIYSKHTGDFRSDCQLELKDKYGTNFPVSSETNIVKIHNGATEEFIHPEDALDIIQKPQNCTDFPKANSTSVYSEDLVKLVRPKDTKRVSFKLLENQLETSKVESENEVTKNSPVVCSEENGDAVLHVQSPVQQPHLHKDTSECLRKNAHSVPNIDSKNDSGKLTSSKQECRLTDLVTDGADAVTISYKEMEENEKMPFEKKTLPKDFQTTSEQTEQLSLVTVVPTDQIDPNCVPALSGIVNVCSRLKHIRRKSEFATISEIDPVSNFAEQLPKLATQPGDSFRVGKDTESKSSNAVRIQEPANVYFESGGASVDTLLDTVHKGACQGRKIRLGIFLPKLPNNRNCNTSNAQDLNKKAEGKEKTAVPEVNLVTRETPENTCLKHNLSPSQFIAEELLPVFPEEMDSNDSLSCDPPDGALSVMDKKEIFPNKRNSHEEQEICSNQKRAIEQEETELQNGKKLKRGDGWDDSAPNQQQPTCNTSHTQAETPECEEPPNLSTKSPDRTHSSSSSSLDSIKADADFSSMQPNSQMESQLLTDSICEQNLLEKFQDGLITVGEFFTLLQVHIVIQKPRQSHLPANYAMNPTSTPEDQFFSQYIYRPKLKIYEEDCQLLSQMINELKLRASDQDKLLVDVNRSLWEVMRTCSDEELKNFGAELNKMKSYFTKKSKVLAHNGKVQLYGKLLQDIQVQWENLHSRMAKVDEFLKEVDNCRLALETSTNLEDYGTENDDQLSEWKSRIRNSENELVDLKAQEEVLQRDLSNLEAEKQQVLAEIKHLKKKTNDCQELLERYNFTEWEISEWSDHQAVFTFLYDSIELTLRFGPPIDGALFNEKPCKKIVDVSFESLLDEERAPLSSRLVKRLIFQFIESQKSWQEKCPTLNHVPQMLREVSLVVCRCRLLGEEIEFLMKWGGKFNLLKTEVDDTKVKLLFSTSTAFAKFEVMLSLSATYPSAPLPFTVQKLIGNLSQDEISAVVSSVPLGTNYLRRMVKLIHHKLFT